NVLGSLDQEQVHTAFHQRPGLFGENRYQLVEGDVSESRIGSRGEEARWSDRARHEAGVFGGAEAVRRAPGNLGRGNVDLPDAISQAVLAQCDAVRTEGVRLHRIAADGEEARMDLLDEIRPGDHQVVVAPLQLRATEVLGGQVVALDRGAHGAIEDDDALAEGAQVRR